MSIFLISKPYSADIQIFKEYPSGSTEVEFVSFDGTKHFTGRFAAADISEIDIALEKVTGAERPKTKVEYVEMVKAAVSHIRKNKLGKIVLSRFEDQPIVISPLIVYLKLVQAYTDACVYLFSHAVYGTWLGATPELLLKLKNGELHTMSLAGTKALNADADLGDKETDEQRMVTDFIVACFRKTKGVENIVCSPPHHRQAGNLIHIQTDIRADLEPGLAPRQLINQLHPTPAVAGLPRNAALQYLEQAESYNRQFYAGYFGLREGDEYTYFVNLRCMQVFSDGIRLFAGGGITAHSDPEAEWTETENKMQTIGNHLL